MSDFTHDLLVYGLAAAKAGEQSEAVSKLERVLSLDPSEEERLEASYWLAIVNTDPVVKRKYLEDVLAIEPHHLLARREWMLLNGQLSANDIIDPNQINAPEPEEKPPELDRFTCPQCGGQMVFSPDGGSLICEYCEARRIQTRKNPVGEQDFLLSMATIKGHSQPQGMTTFLCQGCGAGFILANASLSVSCPYCQTVYVVDSVETHQQAAPAAIFPAKLASPAALLRFDAYRDENQIPIPDQPIQLQGIYLPVWWFSLGGEITYHYQVADKKQKFPVVTNGSRSLLRSDVMIPAAKHDQKNLERMISQLNFDEMVAYKTDYLADWWAETYQVSVSDASLLAREQVYNSEKKLILSDFPGYAENIGFSSHALMIDSFQLVLLPAWMGRCTISGKVCDLFIDALSGEVNLKGWLTPKVTSFWERLFSF